MNATQAGWYADPSVAGQLRYYDGTAWTEHVQPDPSTINIQQVAPQPVAMHPQQAYATPVHHAAPQVQVNQINVAQQPQKSVAVALILTFFFGPLGMLYSTVAGGLIMIAANLILGTLTLGLFFLISWPIQMVWAAVAASNTNKAAAMPTVAVSSVVPMYQQPAAPQAQWQQAAPQQPQWQQPSSPQPAPHTAAPTGSMPALPPSTGGQQYPPAQAPAVGEPHTAELPQAQPGQSNWYS